MSLSLPLPLPLPTLLKSLLILLTNHLTVLATSPPHIASPLAGDRLITDTTPTFRFISSQHAPTVVKVSQYLLGVYEVWRVWTGRGEGRVIGGMEGLGLGLQVVGALGRLRCYQILGRFFTFQSAVRKEHKLITSPFPYTKIRHPSYTFLLLLILGLPTRLLSPTSALLLNPLPRPFYYPIDFVGHAQTFLLDKAGWEVGRGVVAAVLFVLVVGAGMVQQVRALSRRVEVEEKALREEFGREWDEYVERSWKFVPGW